MFPLKSLTSGTPAPVQLAGRHGMLWARCTHKGPGQEGGGSHPPSLLEGRKVYCLSVDLPYSRFYCKVIPVGV